MDELRRDPRPGGVLADPSLAAAVPVHADRPVWAGHPSWTRDSENRFRGAEELFSGKLNGPAAVALVRESRARFALAACRPRVDLRVSAPGAVVGARRIGCATLYDLRPAG